MIFRQVWKKMIFEKLSRFSSFFRLLRFGPDPAERFSVRVQPKNHVLQVLGPQMVRNQSKTTCNLPETLVGHSKITINLLNSAWFGRYSGFLVWIYLGYQHTILALSECCGWWGRGVWKNIYETFAENIFFRDENFSTDFFSMKQNRKNLR